ncbi:MAG TPA: tRNA (guanosine(37)-N1)-methyltransferase TrmD [Gammaproteobacteria bacterium]|jgi:tRNA (guanine37-N1)-methyltransferase|nr:tRNA (guanosine(37)-N1)-methyltransferase TrmD [Gammaproteobacteria bacterium]
MWAGVVTVLPALVTPLLAAGVISRGVREGVLSVECFDPRSYATDRHRTVDDRPFGGGPGMVLKVAPVAAAVAAAQAAWRARAGAEAPPAPVIYLSPQGRTFNQNRARALAALPGLILLAGRYEGIDERAVEQLVDEELSIGDYVLTGGELPALVVLDTVARLLPGTLGNADSALQDSHLDGMLDYPHYTRPEIAGGVSVPAALLSGDHAAIARWRRKVALERTWQRRPDLLVGRTFSAADRELLREIVSEST